MATQVEICNLALTRIGAKMITTISDTSKEAERCAEIWDMCVKAVLEERNWHFARRTLPLTKLRMDEAEPHSIWDYVYRLPSDYILPVKLADSSGIVEQEDEGDWEYEVSQGPYGEELVVNGAMEDNSNWNDEGTPSAQERSTTQVKVGTYSRKFTVDAADEGVKSDTFATVANYKYKYGLWVYPDDTETVNILIRNGGDSGNQVDRDVDGLEKDDWNYIEGIYTEGATGSGAYIAVRSPTGQTSGTWYVDMVTIAPFALVLYTNLDDAYLRYVAEIGTGGTTPDSSEIALFTPKFVSALAWLLASELAISISNSAPSRQEALQMYGVELGKAGAKAALQTRKKSKYTDSWINAR